VEPTPRRTVISSPYRPAPSRRAAPQAATRHRAGPRRARGLVLALLITSACASAPVAAPPSPAPAGIGAVSFNQIRDPTAQPPRADGNREYLRPRLEEGFQLPRYPEAALAAGAPPTEVLVRVVVAEDGSVASVEPSPLTPPPTGAWETLFLAAVREAVAEWRYDPCQLRELEEGPDRDGDGRPDFQVVVASTPLAVYLDLAFRFEVVDGDGRVSTSGGSGSHE